MDSSSGAGAAAATAATLTNVTHFIQLLAQVASSSLSPTTLSSIGSNDNGHAVVDLSSLATATDDDQQQQTTVAVVQSLVAMALTATTTRVPRTDDVGPVTLSAHWPRMARLLVIACLGVVGSIGNVFMVSSVMIEDHLKKAGNAFIVNVALADLLVTCISMPISSIVLLAGIDGPLLGVCQVQWFLDTSAFLITILSLAFSCIENYLRLCTPQDIPSFFNRTKTTTLLLLIWFVCLLAAGLQFTVDSIHFDYCTRTDANNVQPYKTTIVAVVVLLPVVLTFVGHIRIIVDVKRFMRTPNFKQSHNYKWDLELARTNFYSFLIFIAFWAPFGIVLGYNTTAPVPNRAFYTTFWLGLTKSCFHNVVYCITNKHFRNAYVNLFHYCCCKTTVSVSRRQRTDVSCRPASDVRVHIIPGYNMYSYTSPHRAGAAYGHLKQRDQHEL